MEREEEEEGEREEVRPQKRPRIGPASRQEAAAVDTTGNTGMGADDASASSTTSSCPPTSATAMIKDTEALLRVLSSCYLSARHADAIVEVGGEALPCHALLLSGWSRLFSRQLEQHAAQEEQQQQRGLVVVPAPRAMVVKVELGSVECWRGVLRFFYTGEISLTTDNAFEMLEIALHYGIEALIRLSKKYIVASATYANLCDYLDRSHKLNVLDLAEKIKVSIFTQLDKVQHTEGFLRLPFETIKDWVSSDDMGISELTILDAILSWVKGDTGTRSQLLSELLPLVRYPILDAKTLASLKQRDDPLLADPAIAITLNPLIYEALLYNAAPELLSEESRLHGRYRQRNQLVFKCFYTKQIVSHTVLRTGIYRIKAKGAKAADGQHKKGGRGAIVAASFRLQAGTILHILVGGMSTRRGPDSGGGGGTFVTIDSAMLPLLVAGGGGGTRGKESDFDGKDASLQEKGRSGAGTHKAAGGPKGKQGKNANKSYGGGGGGFYGSAEASGKAFVEGGEGGDYGGFGGGGAVGNKGGGGGGGYSGGGGGQGAGGGGSFVRSDAFDVRKKVGCTTDGLVIIRFLGAAPGA